MSAIIFKDNVYVYIRGGKCKDENIKQKEDFFELPGTYDLYGGRVQISLHSSMYEQEIKIDGISILRLDEYYDLEKGFSPSTICAYLNQIHQLGIDTFLANYKVSLEKLKVEITNRLDEIKVTDNKSLISKLNEILNLLTTILFALWMNMNAGLDNHIYTETYNNIINLYFQ